MVKYFSYIGILFLLSCENTETLNIYYENGSDINKKILIETYLEDSLIDYRTVIREDTTIHWELLSIKLPRTNDSIRLQFKIPGTDYSSNCTFSRKQITDKTWMHVNLNEVVFKSGDRIPGQILDKDSVMERNFYCQLVHRPR